MKKTISVVAVLALALIASCAPEEFTVEVTASALTGDPNNNSELEGGERSEAGLDMNVIIKPYCQDAIYVDSRLCLVEKFNDGGTPTEMISVDVNGNQICGRFRTDFPCVNERLVQGSPTCINNTTDRDNQYCSALIAVTTQPMLCGWKIEEAVVFNADGTVVEEMTREALALFGYELFPVEETQ